MCLYAKSCHSHEQGPVEPVLKPIWRYMYTMEYNLISHNYWSHIGMVQWKGSNNSGKMRPHTDVFKSSTQSAKGASLHHVNKWVQVEHNVTSFDYRSLMYIVNKREQPIDNESRYQGIEYIITSLNKGFGVKHLNNPSIKRHWCIPNCRWRENQRLETASL